MREISQESERPRDEPVEIHRKNDTILSNETNRIIFSSQDENFTKESQSDEGKMDVKDLFQLSLQWKFECESCRRYIVINLKVCLITNRIIGRTKNKIPYFCRIRSLIKMFYHFRSTF